MTTTSLSLTELNLQIQQVLRQGMGSSVWVRAEISELRENMNGHCYMELIEKDEVTDQIKARLKASIWASTYRMLKPYFMQAAGTPLQSGMKVLVGGSVDFHELYGMNFTIRDIDPTFTVGDMAMRRAQIIRQLTEEGVLEMNSSLEFPLLPRRIAVISSPTAAGYGDFCDQLKNNPYGYPFYVKLFPAVMQGSRTEESVIEAFDRIYQHLELFDCVVIIRGGGATAELAAFDSYIMASNVAQFPLPVISGIGHQRDDTIIDLVAHTSVKTPTAAAELLIDCVHNAEENVDYLTRTLVDSIQEQLESEKRALQGVVMRLPRQIDMRISQESMRMAQLIGNLKRVSEKRLNSETHKIEYLSQTVHLADPVHLLKKGYSVTTCNGKLLTSTHEVKANDTLTTYLADGTITSKVE